MEDFPVSAEDIGQLAELYDGFTFALDPHCPESAESEKRFMEEVARLYESLHYHLKQQHIQEGGDLKLFSPAVSFHEFRKELIRRCRLHLKATRRRGSV